jgi:hypothetical protein
MPFDHDSPIDVIRRAVVAAVVAAMSQPGRTHISVDAIAEQICPQIILFGKAARHQLRKKVNGICKKLPDELDGRVTYLKPTSTREVSALRIVDSPEAADPHIRTLRYCTRPSIEDDQDGGSRWPRSRANASSISSKSWI